MFFLLKQRNIPTDLVGLQIGPTEKKDMKKIYKKVNSSAEKQYILGRSCMPASPGLVDSFARSQVLTCPEELLVQMRGTKRTEEHPGPDVPE